MGKRGMLKTLPERASKKRVGGCLVNHLIMNLESINNPKFQTFEPRQCANTESIIGGGVRYRMSSGKGGGFDEGELCGSPGNNTWDDVVWRSSDYWSLTTDFQQDH
jgi:hypothetical protein